jgi:hypothetical protein
MKVCPGKETAVTFLGTVTVFHGCGYVVKWMNEAWDWNVSVGKPFQLKVKHLHFLQGYPENIHSLPSY